ncbi:MAG: anti-sigma factor antagonist [Bacteroidetes bacterium]|nr:MAG: anti-sigma factor antagonist [Bacteroidota bacterium]
MEITFEEKDKYVLVSVDSIKLDSKVSPELKSQFVFLNNNNHKNILLDLSKVKYCDSSGLSAILIGNRLCKNANGSFILFGLQENVMKLITISQLDTVLNITPTFTEALDLLYIEEVGREIDEEDND